MSSTIHSTNTPYADTSYETNSAYIGADDGSSAEGAAAMASVTAALGQGQGIASSGKTSNSTAVSDIATRSALPSQQSGVVGNVQPYDKDYSTVASALNQNGITAPSEQDVANYAKVAGGSTQARTLIDGVKSNIKSGTAAPNANDYAEQQQQFVQQLQENSSSTDSDDGSGVDISKVKSPALLVMYVFLQAKSELQNEKQDDLQRIQKYSNISSLLTNTMNSQLLPAQQELQGKVAAQKDTSKQNQQTVTINVPNNVDLNYYKTNSDGSIGLIDTTNGGNGQASTTSQTVNTTQMGSVLQAYQNMNQQVQQSMQREQTTYSGHDSQDSTLSNIITAVNNSFRDGVNAIVGHIG